MSGIAFYMALRQKQKLMDAGTYKEVKTKIVDGYAWVSVTMPNGEQKQMLVNEEQQVLHATATHCNTLQRM